jgi:DNA processing protein
MLIGIAATGRAGWREWQRLDQGGVESLDFAARGSVEALARRGLRPKQIESFLEAIRSGDGARVIENCLRRGIAVTTVEDEGYPARLLQLPNPPLALFSRGRLPAADEFLVAIVGSRRASRYGKRVARALAGDLSRAGLGVVSGLARGIDTEAHEGSLAGPGSAFAVVGSGLDEPYPPENVGLAIRLEGPGGVLGEFAPGVPPRPQNFPRRNRIIAALAHLVIVVEAAARSGALITARWAADLGRDVAAIPGPVDAPASAGPLALIRDGARMIRGIEDLVEDQLVEVDLSQGEAGAEREKGQSSGMDAAALDADERRLLALLDREPTDLDSLLGALDLAPGTVLARLLSLELRGWVEKDEALRFSLRPQAEGA